MAIGQYDLSVPKPHLSARLLAMLDRVATLSDVRADVVDNHDNNRWWPLSITDPRMRMAAAGWSTRISYSMVDKYVHVITQCDLLGFDRLSELADVDVVRLVRPLGLPRARLTYLRSLSRFLKAAESDGIDLASLENDELIARIARDVSQASFKVAHCAVLYSRGYHCGVIPVDSGMVSRLAPILGMHLSRGPRAHEQMRLRLERCVSQQPNEFHRLIRKHEYPIRVPKDKAPTWWVHLALIYFKRRYLNRPSARICAQRPACSVLIDCSHPSNPVSS